MGLTRPRYSQIYDTDYKQSVRLATTGIITNLVGGAPNSVDGVTVSANDRILVKDQVTGNAYQNGIYYVSAVGTGSNGTWVRALDADANDKVTSGLTTTVSEGSSNAYKTFKLATPDPIVLGVTALTFVNPFSSGAVGGADTQIQFNDTATAGGAVSLRYYKGNGVIIANAGVASTSTTTGTFQVTGGIGVTGTVFSGNINTTGNVVSAGGIFNTLTVNGATTQAGTLTVSSGFINSTGNIIAANINAGGVRQTTSATVPTIRTVGDQWYDSTTDTLFQFVTDGTSFFWVDITGQPLNVNIAAVQGTSLSITGTGTVTGALTTNSTLTVNSGNNLTAIINGGSSGVGNIGSAATTFNTVFAKASSAQYADLAEVYVADIEYEPGTVLIFGGTAEVTKSTQSHDTRVAGVVSTNPAYLMNSQTKGVSVALTGRIPCWVKGPITKGDRLVASDVPGIAERLDIAQYQPGCIIGKSLESIDSSDVLLIEIAIGRF